MCCALTSWKQSFAFASGMAVCGKLYAKEPIMGTNVSSSSFRYMQAQFTLQFFFEPNRVLDNYDQFPAQERIGLLPWQFVRAFEAHPELLLMGD